MSLSDSDIARLRSERMKIAKGCLIGTAALVMLVTVIVIIVGISAGSNKNTPLNPIAVDAQDLYSSFNSNQVAADQQYKDRIVSITGLVQNVGRDILGTPYVMLASGKPYAVWGVQCLFSTSDEAKLARLTKGQKITVRGKVTGYLINVIVEDSIIE